MGFEKFWPFKKEEAQMPRSLVIALAFSTIALAMAFAMTRWSLIVLDEQMKMRKDLNDTKSQLQQLKSQNDMLMRQMRDPRMLFGRQRDGMMQPNTNVAPSNAVPTPMPTQPVTKAPTTTKK
jgi:hypothetical protein